MNFSARTALPILFLALAAYFLYSVQDMLLPFVLAAVLAYLFNPLIRFFEVRGLRRRPVAIVLYIAVVSIFLMGTYKFAWLAGLEAEKAARNMPIYVKQGSEAVARWKTTTRMNQTLVETVVARGREWPQQVLERMPSFALGIIPVLEILFFVPFIGFFFIQEGPRWRDHILEWVPPRYVEMVLGLLVEVDNSLGKYVRGVCLEAFCVGCIALAGFWVIGLDYAVQIAFVVGLANIVPYVGPVIGGILGGGVALFQWGTPMGIVKVLLVCGMVRFVEDWFVQPYVMQKAVRLHPVVILFSLMAGTKLFGFWGLLFAIPVASMIKVLLEVLWPWYRAQYGLPNTTPLPEATRVPLV
jgi:predicted PurR-regulated permease PerM